MVLDQTQTRFLSSESQKYDSVLTTEYNYVMVNNDRMKSIISKIMNTIAEHPILMAFGVALGIALAIGAAVSVLDNQHAYLMIARPNGCSLTIPFLGAYQDCT